VSAEIAAKLIERFLYKKAQPGNDAHERYPTGANRQVI
jgi:hypothetical protein